MVLQPFLQTVTDIIFFLTRTSAIYDTGNENIHNDANGNADKYPF